MGVGQLELLSSTSREPSSSQRAKPLIPISRPVIGPRRCLQNSVAALPRLLFFNSFWANFIVGNLDALLARAPCTIHLFLYNYP
jgi:hypothetical protein